MFASVFFFLLCRGAGNARSSILVDVEFYCRLSAGNGGAALVVMGLAQGSWLIILSLVFIGATNNLWHPAAIPYLSERFPVNRGYVLSIIPWARVWGHDRTVGYRCLVGVDHVADNGGGMCGPNLSMALVLCVIGWLWEANVD